MSPRLLVTAALAGLVALVLGAVAWALIGDAARHTAVVPDPTQIDYVVVPHPDDEFQAWSLLERDDSTYKVFILLTRGEQTAFCEPGAYAAGWQRDLEPPAEPRPRGRWTPSCERARLTSWVSFFAEQAKSDKTLPGDLRPTGTSDALPAPRGLVCRQDQDDTCVVDTTAEVWLDAAGRGALVALNLGDGDLTPREVAWAVRTVRKHRHGLGIDVRLSKGGLIGASFANSTYDCFEYPHPDHLAVHEALYEIDFNMAYQAGATCADDPDVAWSRIVSPRSAAAAFSVDQDGTRTGAHTASYGWLAKPYYKLDRQAQRRLFHTKQEFWVRFVN